MTPLSDKPAEATTGYRPKTLEFQARLRREEQEARAKAEQFERLNVRRERVAAMSTLCSPGAALWLNERGRSRSRTSRRFTSCTSAAARRWLELRPVETTATTTGTTEARGSTIGDERASTSRPRDELTGEGLQRHDLLHLLPAGMAIDNVLVDSECLVDTNTLTLTALALDSLHFP